MPTVASSGNDSSISPTRRISSSFRTQLVDGLRPDPMPSDGLIPYPVTSALSHDGGGSAVGLTLAVPPDLPRSFSGLVPHRDHWVGSLRSTDSLVRTHVGNGDWLETQRKDVGEVCAEV